MFIVKCIELLNLNVLRVHLDELKKELFLVTYGRSFFIDRVLIDIQHAAECGSK